MQAYATAIYSRVKDPHKVFKDMLTAIERPATTPKTTAQDRKRALLAGLRGLVARNKRKES